MGEAAVKKNEVIVVKVGGSTWESRDAALDDLVSLQREGYQVVVAHGAGGLIPARRRPELGFVGDIEGVDAELLRSLLEGGYMPVVAPVGINSGGEALPSQLLNINADTVAGEIALALAADFLVFLTDVPGIRDARGEVMGRLSAQEAQALTEAGTIGGGMLPKVEACLRAAASHTTALIVDGRWAHALQAALKGQIAGTSVG